MTGEFDANWKNVTFCNFNATFQGQRITSAADILRIIQTEVLCVTEMRTELIMIKKLFQYLVNLPRKLRVGYQGILSLRWSIPKGEWGEKLIGISSIAERSVGC